MVKIQINYLGKTDFLELKKLKIKIIRQVQKIVRGEGCRGKSLSLTFTNDLKIRELNRKYRKLDRATDVLSFVMDEEEMLGDVVISVESAVRNAKRFKQKFSREIERLVVHGVLHLLGYDHKKSKDRDVMRKKEEEYLCRGD